MCIRYLYPQFHASERRVFPLKTRQTYGSGHRPPQRDSVVECTPRIFPSPHPIWHLTNTSMRLTYSQNYFRHLARLSNSPSCQMNIARQYKEFSYSALQLQAFANRIHGETQHSLDRRTFDVYCLCRFQIVQLPAHLDRSCPTYCSIGNLSSLNATVEESLPKPMNVETSLFPLYEE